MALRYSTTSFSSRLAREAAQLRGEVRRVGEPHDVPLLLPGEENFDVKTDSEPSGRGQARGSPPASPRPIRVAVAEKDVRLAMVVFRHFTW
jgi:hypothetical protein